MPTKVMPEKHIPLRVLLVEDSEDSEVLLRHALRKGGFAPRVGRVETESQMRQRLAEEAWDVVISDFSLPTFDGIGALDVLKESGKDLPFIIVSGTIGEERAVQLMRAGAHDYVMKENLTRLGPVISRELAEAHHRRARREAEQALRHQAKHDALTGLLNRYELERRLKQLIEDARGGRVTHVLGYVDLDQFKVVNDSCGHIAGDGLLRQVAALMQQSIREADLLGRLGGDEFGLLLQGCGLQQAERVAEQMVEAVRHFRFEWEGRSFPIGISMGLVAIDADSDDSVGLMAAVDSACYLAKQKGGGRYQVYRASDAELAHRRKEMEWVSRLTEAFEKDLFCLYQQPIVSLVDGTVAHYELLLRMCETDSTLILPTQFIAAAERYKVMGAIDRWVVTRAFQWIKEHPKLARGLTFGINLSGQSLSDEQFLDFVTAGCLGLGDLSASVAFEVTETAVISNLDRAVRFIEQMRRLGCCFFLDDFGSGLASFAYLKSLSVDYLKIDGYLVENLLTDPLDCAIVEAVHHVGRSVGMKTVVEWVSSQAMLAKLAEMGVDYAQGYGVGLPRPLEALADPELATI